MHQQMDEPTDKLMDELMDRQTLIRVAVKAYHAMDSSRRRGIASKLCIENIYQNAYHLVHGKLVPPYHPQWTETV